MARGPGEHVTMLQRQSPRLDFLQGEVQKTDDGAVGSKNTKTFRYQKCRNPESYLRLFFRGWVFSYISHIHTAYIVGDYIHCRYLARCAAIADRLYIRRSFYNPLLKWPKITWVSQGLLFHPYKWSYNPTRWGPLTTIFVDLSLVENPFTTMLFHRG